MTNEELESLLRKPVWNATDICNYCSQVGVKLSKSAIYKLLKEDFQEHKVKYISGFYPTDIILEKLFNTNYEKEINKWKTN